MSVYITFYFGTSQKAPLNWSKTTCTLMHRLQRHFPRTLGNMRPTRSAAEQAVTDHAEEGGRGGTEGLTMRRQTTVASVTSWGRTQPQPGRGRPSGPRGQGASSPGLPCVDSRQPPSQRYTAVSANMSPPPTASQRSVSQNTQHTSQIVAKIHLGGYTTAGSR